jgi:hypothetical protein
LEAGALRGFAANAPYIFFPPANQTKIAAREARHRRERRDAREVSSDDGMIPPLHHTETAMFAKTTKTLVAALVLAGASITFVANASAAPAKGPTQDELNWMNRSSGLDGGGYGGGGQ